MKTKALLTALTLLMSLQLTQAQEEYKGVPVKVDKSSRSLIDYSNWDNVEHTGTQSDFIAIQFTDDEHGWVIGKDATIIFTKDAGQSWEERYFGPSVTYYDIHFVDNRIGFVVGSQDIGTSSIGIAYKTNDGGQNWEMSYFSEPSMIINSISFADSETGYISGISLNPAGNYAVVFKTTDTGAGWRRVPVNSLVDNIDNITFSYDKDSKEIADGWATGIMNKGPLEVSVILNSGDGGVSWNTNYAEHIEFGFKDVNFYDSQNGITIGETGVVMTTIDAGNNWMVHDLGQFALNAALVVNNNYNILVGDNGLILSTHDDGQNWVQEHTVIDNNLNAVCTTPSGFLWIAGDEGTLFSTHGSRINVQDFAEHSWEIGARQGVSIINQVSNDYIENNEGLIVAHKNYPNPSSGTTTIYFELHQQAYVKLDIYNISGKLISNLIDQDSDEGYHEAMFDASEWPSGIYTYILRAGNHVENGKIIIP